MFIIFGITAFLILAYLAYPFWLMISGGSKEKTAALEGDACSVSLILLSYNGINYLEEKIDFLTRELASFQYSELIIIDDNSSDGSKELLKTFTGRENVRIILKNEHKGIPHTMNMGVENAKYDYIVFCDQRQALSRNILKRLVEPLRFENTGAVSACISDVDKAHCCSGIRRHENFVKSRESCSGNLIGVYGPLYAIKKQCYSPIPDYIILEDLYLSLKILKTKQIKILDDCKITDEGIEALYSYSRARRYIHGFLQLTREKDLISQLTCKQIIMLLWHKYLRLLIPVFLFLSYVCLGVMGLMNKTFLVIFILLNLAGLVSLLPGKTTIQERIRLFIRINFYYFVALVDVLIVHEIRKPYWLRPGRNKD
jgi:poly-beta-1,6-N-acetyl-D-glucosamine synthase